jgi:hypothetical protein
MKFDVMDYLVSEQLIEGHALQLYNYGQMATSTPVKVLLLVQCLLKECSLLSSFPSGMGIANGGDNVDKQSATADQILPTLIAGISNLVLSILVRISDVERG